MCRWNSKEQLLRGGGFSSQHSCHSQEQYRNSVGRDVKDLAQSNVPFASSTSSKTSSTKCSPASLISLHSSPQTQQSSYIEQKPAKCPPRVPCCYPCPPTIPPPPLPFYLQPGYPFSPPGQVDCIPLASWAMMSQVTAILPFCGFYSSVCPTRK